MAESEDQLPRTKRRGVRASRIKLEQALGNSDLERKTQAALAERIADIEELDAAPKDLVSKVFRELPVDPQTLERVARGLGVEAKTLYLEADETPRDIGRQAMANGDDGGDDGGGTAAVVETAARLSRIARLQTLAFFSLAFSLLLLGGSLAIRPSGPLCGLREAVERSTAEEGRLGFVVARFSGDPDNRAQQYLATSLANDRDLASYTSVLATCARPRWTGPGDLRRKLADIRHAGRKKLARTGAHVMLWGELDGDDIIVRFITTRRDASAFAVEVSGRPLKVEEDNLELRVPIGRPSEGLADVKRFALELIEPGDETLADIRSKAMQSYKSSADWLRAAIISQRNLARMVDPAINAQRWAAINMQLCYDLRLLGDYDAAADDYRDALEACDNALSVRPKDRFPNDWASLQVNKASSHIRLHYYAQDREDAIKSLQAAEDALLSVLDSSDSAPTPQQQLTARRNLGVVYLRFGELTQGDVSSDYFEKGLSSLKTALDALDPAYQPLDWAITQQNICLALYQHGARLGADGASLVREAKDRCRDAVGRLSPDNTAIDWAMAQNNLAAATAILAQMESDVSGLGGAIHDFTAAQSVYRRETLPENWAEVELNLGELYCNLAVLNDDPSAFGSSLSHLDAALEVFIGKGNERYRRYAENLATSVKACQAGRAAACVCGG